MSGMFGMAADWLEFGRPGEQSAAAEAALYGALLWDMGGVRAYERQTEDVYRLSLVGAGGPMAYEVAGVDGGCFR